MVMYYMPNPFSGKYKVPELLSSCMQEKEKNAMTCRKTDTEIYTKTFI